MMKYVYKILEGFIKVIKRTAATPSWDNLFRVQAKKVAEYMLEELAVAFYHTMAKLLFLSQRARGDIQLPTSLLT